MSPDRSAHSVPVKVLGSFRVLLSRQVIILSGLNSESDPLVSRVMSQTPGRPDGRQRLGWVSLAGRELSVLALVAVATYGTTAYATVPWVLGGMDCAPGTAWLLAALTVVPALVRRWVPSLSLLASAVLFGWFPASGIALALMSYNAAWRVKSVPRRVIVLALAALIPFGTGLVASRYQWLMTAIVFGISALVCVIAPAMVRILLGQRDRLVTALRERTDYLEENYRLADSEARLAERSRIAEEMHDLLGHRLSLISLYAGALELDAAERSPELADEARLVRGTVFHAMAELRTVLGLLRSDDDPDGPEQPDNELGTSAAVRKLVTESRSAGAQVELSWIGEDLTDAAPPVRRAVHRVVR